MGFHMCPLDPKVQKIFIGNEAGLLKKRVPISVWARSNYKKCEIPYVDWKSGKSMIEDHLISLNILNKVDNKIISMAISHIAPISERNYLNINVSGCKDINSKNDYTRVDIKIFKNEITEIKGSLLGELIYHILHNNKNIYLEWIKYPYRNNGKKLLIALYNIAKDLGIKRIFFYPDNTLAKQFYYHMDFGSNDYEVDQRKANDWKVGVE